jgi:hypothetical protein
MHKLIWPIAFIAAFVVPVYAQQPSEFTFKVTPAEVDVIAKGLETQPYKDVVPLLQKLREQFTAQQAKAPDAIPVPKEAPEKKE